MRIPRTNEVRSSRQSKQGRKGRVCWCRVSLDKLWIALIVVWTIHHLFRIQQRDASTTNRMIPRDHPELALTVNATEPAFLWDFESSQLNMPIFLDLFRSVHGTNASNNERNFGAIPAVWENGTIFLYRVPWRRRLPVMRDRLKQVWPLLHQAAHELSATAKSMPLLLNLRDYRSCLYQNYQNRYSLPMLTFSSSPTCPCRLSIPSYTTLQIAKSTQAWDDFYSSQRNTIPNKIPKASWRGGLSGLDYYPRGQSPRYKLAVLGKQRQDILDVAVAYWDNGTDSGSQRRQEVRKYHMERQRNKPYRLEPFMSMEDLSRHQLLLDIDGNSWSERFPKLLCESQSVVVKIDPEQVDYFWDSLQAGTHYVAANLTNLVQVVHDALQDPLRLQRIVDNAQAWCRVYMTPAKLLSDVKSILQAHQDIWDRSDPEWGTQWEKVRPQFERAWGPLVQI